MKTEYLSELTPLQLKKELSYLEVELAERQYEILLRNGRTFLYAHPERKKREGNIIYRLTYLIFLLWSLIVTIIIQPIKWLFTGNIYFDTDNPIYKFTVNWRRKIG